MASSSVQITDDSTSRQRKAQGVSSAQADSGYGSRASSRSTSPLVSTPGWERARKAWLAPGSGWVLNGEKPLSHLLKEATAQAHTDVLRPPVVNKLITGQIPLDTHITYLMMLYDVYDTLESALARHSDHALLASIYNPSSLARAEYIAEDITFLLGLSAGSDWTSHPTAQSYRQNPPAALTEYVERLRALDEDTGEAKDDNYVYPPPPASAYLLLSHAYVRYMGDLNGGQLIKNSVAKAYKLPEDSSEGLRFYRFGTEDGEECSAAELSQLTSWYRRGMDTIGDDIDSGRRAELLQEANHAFELNIRLFSSFSEDDGQTLAIPNADRPAIPSPSLEGYAKAATYMPKKDTIKAATAKRVKNLEKEDVISGHWWIVAFLPLLLVIAYIIPMALMAEEKLAEPKRGGGTFY